MKSSRIMRFPWEGHDVPHGLLDIVGCCNSRCAGCYNKRSRGVKPVGDILRELDQMLALRRLQTVTLSGGEPTLHPDLAEIVRSASDRNLKVALLTNGSTLCEELLLKLSKAGLSVILLHIQTGQERHDLPVNCRFEAIQKHRSRLADLIQRHGMEAGLSVIAYRSRLDELQATVREVLESPFLNFLLVTEFTDFSRFNQLFGNLTEGLRAQHVPANTEVPFQHEEVCNEDVLALMTRVGFGPYACIGSTQNIEKAKWLSYLIAVVKNRTGLLRMGEVKASLSDRLLLHMTRIITGRHIFFHKSRPRLFKLRLFLNALSGGHGGESMKLIALSFLPGNSICDKHIVFQEGPRLLPSGAVDHCRNCPDAVIVHGSLVPVCLADRLSSERSE